MGGWVVAVVVVVAATALVEVIVVALVIASGIAAKAGRLHACGHCDRL